MLHEIHDQGIEDRFVIDSAGTAGYHIGAKADARMREHARLRGYDLPSRARKLSGDDLDAFDMVIAMDRENFDDVNRLGKGRAEVRLLSSFLDDSWPTDVPDPYYGGADGFEYVLDMIEAAVPNIIEEFVGEKEG